MNEEMLDFFATIIKDESKLDLYRQEYSPKINDIIYSIDNSEMLSDLSLATIKKYIENNNIEKRAYYFSIIQYYAQSLLYNSNEKRECKKTLDILLKEAKTEKECLIILRRIVQTNERQFQIISNVQLFIVALLILKKQRSLCYDSWYNYLRKISMQFPEYMIVTKLG